METFVKADIFFFVTTVAIAALSIVLLAILINIYRIVRNVRKTSDEIREKGQFLTNIVTLDVLRVRKLLLRAVGRVFRRGKRKKDEDVFEETDKE